MPFRDVFINGGSLKFIICASLSVGWIIKLIIDFYHCYQLHVCAWQTPMISLTSLMVYLVLCITRWSLFASLWRQSQLNAQLLPTFDTTTTSPLISPLSLSSELLSSAPHPSLIMTPSSSISERRRYTPTSSTGTFTGNGWLGSSPSKSPSRRRIISDLAASLPSG
jgi:hypothetical protein